MAGPQVAGPGYVTQTNLLTWPSFVQCEPTIDPLDDRKGIVTYNHVVAGPTQQTWARAIDATGLAIGSDVQMPTSNIRHISGVAGGGFVSCWWDNGPREVYAQLFDAAFAAVTGVITVATIATGTFENSWPIGLNDGAGGFAVSWEERVDGSTWSVKFRRYDASGSPLAAAQEVDGISSGVRAFDHRVTRLTDDTICFEWRRFNGAGDLPNFVQTFDSSMIAPGSSKFQWSATAGVSVAFPKGLFPLDAAGFAIIGGGNVRYFTGVGAATQTISTAAITPLSANYAYVAPNGNFIPPRSDASPYCAVRLYTISAGAYVYEGETVAFSPVPIDDTNGIFVQIGSIEGGNPVVSAGIIETPNPPTTYAGVYQVFGTIPGPNTVLRLPFFLAS